MSFFGSTDIEKVFGTIEYAIEKYNISHIVIDTLQFLLSDQATGFEKFDLQDRVMARLRRIANQHQVHVCVVIHPRKTDEGEDLGLHSIFGTSKSVQEADNVWLIQQR
jgi:twinkle protein